jgi:hypothetical protein
MAMIDSGAKLPHDQLQSSICDKQGVLNVKGRDCGFTIVERGDPLS